MGFQAKELGLPHLAQKGLPPASLQAPLPQMPFNASVPVKGYGPIAFPPTTRLRKLPVKLGPKRIGEAAYPSILSLRRSLRPPTEKATTRQRVKGGRQRLTGSGGC